MVEVTVLNAYKGEKEVELVVMALVLNVVGEALRRQRQRWLDL